MNWEVVIGLETHAQLRTKSKIFSGSSIAFGAEPNVQASAVDIALPGVLPVLNREAVVCAIKFGLAVGAQIAPRSIFARKNYFYPDLPKGYQISQFEIPVVLGGGLTIRVGAGDTATEKFVHLTRAHLEEDAGKSLHEDFHGRTGIDLNRAGTPLLEIVTEPEMRSSAEAVAYAKALHALVQWIGICDGNMQEGSFRCDANVSVRPLGQKEFGTRREIKNLNSFRFMQQAIDFEVQWQINEIEEGRAIHQATVLFDPDSGETRSMRSKEDAHDYRYFPDPDLLPLEITADWIAQVKSGLPELPQAMKARFEADYGLSPYDAAILTGSRGMAEYFTAAVDVCNQPKLVANWVINEVRRSMSEGASDQEGEPLASEVRDGLPGRDVIRIPAGKLAKLISRITDATISNAGAKKVFIELWTGPDQEVDEVIERMGLKQITDTGAIEALVDEVLAANQKSVEEYRAGKEKAFNALVGQAMKATRGKANPQQVTDLLKKKLGA
ncbi:MAG: Asp-tRNA(Asn)/Glu-tRNA(Gln) amidotransferase subunit GatB [Sulfuritalea sp.]|jgi:aspartyl-tRNA(Asn)/glutamyl-tRNA(Gln) amidotransferase subunit B|nr:Asp-tRNA(Asn)/Glu-tRNA(Gln) amidotransferase subunit GatB [Sulfuritalea sp.]